MTTQNDQDPETAWCDALDRLAGNLDPLVDGFLVRILADRQYAQSEVSVEDLRSTSAQSFLAMIKSLKSGGEETSALESLADSLGARRARQGIPVDSLVRAVRMDFSVIWQGLAAPDSGLSSDHLVSKGELVWQTVDTFVAKVQARYLREQADLERADVDLQQHYLSQLFSMAETTRTDILRIAGALRVDADSEFRVVAMGREEGAIVQRRLRSHRRLDRTFSIPQGHHTLFIHELADSKGPMDIHERNLYDGVAVAVAPTAHGLVAVRDASMAAREIMRDLPVNVTGVFTLKNRLLSIARHRLAQVGCSPANATLDGLERTSPKEREKILETTRVFLETGSLVETSKRLFYHRNTIVNRMSAFERYTGLDLKSPRDLAIAVLILCD
ncbi:helix-turn-helix domain-containing protein [Glutamicibacter sp. JL.03c]|uniref:helix-turn-helix domain-containing protein n=1 Tax=Glutamicibacter sp. JL.03c TaxID=2984842 RepID=UPI0021F71B1A|nr:helix-turn-helix domain-containing protein [Glutamicibacter sp. JL.03c]UYQ77472.1 helix-turn-helix domain-containing protein [Glutamicibacter sp. JL.03c]